MIRAKYIKKPENYCHQSHLSSISKYKTIALKKLSKNGRILIRPSGTEALIRILVEDQYPIIVEQTAKLLADSINNSINTN